ncbi:MAG TPA: hypothetical protein VFO44_00665 [Steroidobacteraceae bacterium]|nr:hypothetical protein [Steroidobacteraceae bacterium]
MGTSLRMLVIILAAPFLMAQSTLPQSPTVDQILAHYERAMGGKAAFKKVHSLVIRGTIAFPAKNLSGTTAEYFKSPDHFLAVTEVPGYGTVRVVYDGKSAWTEDPKRGVAEITGPALADMRRRADIQWHVKLKELYPTLKLKGREKIDGRDAWVLEAKEDQWTFRLCFDAATGLLIRFDTDTGDQEGLSSVSIADYRRVENLEFSYRAAMSKTAVVWSRELTDVKINVPIDDALFLKASVGKDADKHAS